MNEGESHHQGQNGSLRIVGEWPRPMQSQMSEKTMYLYHMSKFQTALGIIKSSTSIVERGNAL